MNAVMLFNKDAKSHQYSFNVYDYGTFCFGVAIDAGSEDEAREKVNERWGRYQERLAEIRKPPQRSTRRLPSVAMGISGKR
jgi:hypothetical protein